MIIVLSNETAEEEAQRYAGALESIGNDPARLGDMARDDAEFCVLYLHSRLIDLTRAMQAKASQAECEAAVAYFLHSGEPTLDRQVTVALKRMQAGLPQTLRDLAAVWVSNCAIKNQIEFAMERNASAVN